MYGQKERDFAVTFPERFKRQNSTCASVDAKCLPRNLNRRGTTKKRNSAAVLNNKMYNKYWLWWEHQYGNMWCATNISAPPAIHESAAIRQLRNINNKYNDDDPQPVLQ